MKKLLSFSLSLVLIFAFAINSVKAEEYGMASMFSDNFHGKKTASGELYDVNKLTASHKSLPFGSRIKITRLDNNSSVIARVNDRGPYTKGRVVELSRKAAREIGLTDGEVKVKVELVSTYDDESKPKPAPIVKEEEPAPKAKTVVTAKGDDKKKKAETKPITKPVEKPVTPKVVAVKPPVIKAPETKGKSGELVKIQVAKPDRDGYGLQVASLASYEAAMRKIAELQEDYFKNVLLFSDKSNTATTYKIILGPFPDATTAETYKQTAKKKKLNGFVINLKTMERP